MDVLRQTHQIITQCYESFSIKNFVKRRDAKIDKIRGKENPIKADSICL